MALTKGGIIQHITQETSLKKNQSSQAVKFPFR